MSPLPSSCTVTNRSPLKLRHFYPLIGFALPSLIVGYGVVIPRSTIAGINELTIGFGTTVLGACLAYIAGLRSALRTDQAATVCRISRSRWVNWRRPTFIARQAAHPSGFLGRLLGQVMARETARDNDVTLEHLELMPTDRVLELGFGHGRSIRRAAQLVTHGQVDGVDPSLAMVHMAQRRNRDFIRTGRVCLRQGDARTLPYADESFDKVHATHTVYFWKDFDSVLHEIRRVLKREGCLVLGFRYDAAQLRAFPASVYSFRSPEIVATSVQQAGFSNVRIETQSRGAVAMHWVVARGRVNRCRPDGDGVGADE